MSFDDVNISSNYLFLINFICWGLNHVHRHPKSKHQTNFTSSSFGVKRRRVQVASHFLNSKASSPQPTSTMTVALDSSTTTCSSFSTSTTTTSKFSHSTQNQPSISTAPLLKVQQLETIPLRISSSLR